MQFMQQGIFIPSDYFKLKYCLLLKFRMPIYSPIHSSAKCICMELFITAYSKYVGKSNLNAAFISLCLCALIYVSISLLILESLLDR